MSIYSCALILINYEPLAVIIYLSTGADGLATTVDERDREVFFENFFCYKVMVLFTYNRCNYRTRYKQNHGFSHIRSRRVVVFRTGLINIKVMEVLRKLFIKVLKMNLFFILSK